MPDIFPIVRDPNRNAFGRCRSQEDILQFLNLLISAP